MTKTMRTLYALAAVVILGAVVYTQEAPKTGTGGEKKSLANEKTPNNVTSLNTLQGDLTLVAGPNISITPSRNSLTIEAPNALTRIVHDNTLTGNGTAALPLRVDSSSQDAALAAIQSKLDGLMSQIAALAFIGQRQFYLTKTTHTGSQALSACAVGYHMASIAEIHEPSNLRYNTELGRTQADSGSGAPISPGWLRTGTISNALPTAGTGNCYAWTSDSPSDGGSYSSLSTLWNSGVPAAHYSPWIGASIGCNTSQPVWCVQD